MTPPPTPEERARAFTNWWDRRPATRAEVERDLAERFAAEREAGRREGVEQAAKVCEDIVPEGDTEPCGEATRWFAAGSDAAGRYIAKAIRALAEPRTKGDG